MKIPLKIPFEWETLDKATFRAKVIGGWVILSFYEQVGTNERIQSESMVFIPDPDHQWEIK
jgi:hypothetical protein